LLDRDGECCDPSKTFPFFDEIVIPQEAQLVPAFIVEMSGDQMTEVLQHWVRRNPQTDASPSMRMKIPGNQNIQKDHVSLDETV